MLAVDEVNVAPPLQVMFAVCDELNERIILTYDTVKKFELLQQYSVIHVPEAVNAMTNIVDMEDDDLSGSSDDDVIPLDGSSECVVASIQDSSVTPPNRPTTSDQPDIDSQMRSAVYVTLHNEQITDLSLSKYWGMARDG